MRVLHVVAGSTRRGAEVFASDLVGALNERGVSQRVAVLRSGGPELDYPVGVSFLGQGGRRIPGVRLNSGGVRRLRSLTHHWQPDVVQAHGGEALKHCVLSNWPRSRPIVYRRIGGAPKWITRGPRRAAHGALMRRATRVVAVADAVREETVHMFGVPEARVLTIPNGVDPRRLESAGGRDARRALGLAGDARVLLSVGALTWEKDPLHQLSVAAEILREIPEAIYLIAGDGPMSEPLESAVERAGLVSRVRVLGVRRDLGDLLAASDVMVFASVVHGMEGMPASVIEAGMTGVPTVAYSVAGLAEVVEDGVTGILVAPGDKAGLAAGIRKLLMDDAAREAMGEAARRRCRENFGISSVASKYLALYEDVAATR